jgi:hypothetical protein
MACNELGNSTAVKQSSGEGCFAAVVLPCKDQRVVALKAFVVGKLKLAPSTLTGRIVIPKPGSIIKGGEQAATVKLNGTMFGTKLSTIVIVHAPQYTSRSKNAADNQDFVNPFWLVRWTDNPKYINMKSVNESIDVAGLTVTCQTLINTKDIAVGEQLYVKAMKTFV